MTRDSRTLFQRLSQKLQADFEVSGHIQHAPSKGTVRENALREFLAQGRLPMKYGIGSGEIIGHVRDVSPQCDLVIYDQINGATLISDPSVQVFPIESVYGIIEVKSSLSKKTLIDGLEKIKAVKAMKPFGNVAKHVGGGMQLIHARPGLFGMIFAYTLDNNSLDSLLENVREWEGANAREVWPNYVCVLETGIIYHQGKPFEEHLTSESINDESWPTSFPWKQDSLFKFYITLLDICSKMDLGPVELARYFDPATKIGKHFVDGHVEFTVVATGKKRRFSESALDRVVAWGEAHAPMKYGDLLIKRFGGLPVGMDGSSMLQRDVRLYSPSGVQGLAELREQGVDNLSQDELLKALGQLYLHEIVIDGKLYSLSLADFSETDFDEVP